MMEKILNSKWLKIGLLAVAGLLLAAGLFFAGYKLGQRQIVSEFYKPGVHVNPTEAIKKPGYKCATYTRYGNSFEKCATCGDGVCEEYERCTSSSCVSSKEGGICLPDCGGLYCSTDCE